MFFNLSSSKRVCLINTKVGQQIGLTHVPMLKNELVKKNCVFEKESLRVKKFEGMLTIKLDFKIESLPMK